MSDVVQLSFDYSLVTEEQASQLQSIYNRVLIRHMSTAYEDGRDMLEAKSIKNLPYKMFIEWAEKVFGWTEDNINKKINVAQNFGPTIPGIVISEKAMYLLSTKRVPDSARQEAKDRATSGETITEEVAKQIRDAHKAREQAEKEAELANQQLWQTQDVLKTRSEQLNAKIDNLQLQIKNLESQLDSKEPSPKVEKQIKELTQQRNNLSQLVEDLGKDLETLREETEVKRAQEMQDLRIRQNWRTITDAFHKQVLKLLSQFPTSIDTQVFESEDWDRLSQVQELARRFQAECSNLNSRSMSFVDAG